ncbi:MAG: glycosyltransferase [Eubacteriales bacterium]
MRKIMFHLNCLEQGGAERVVTNLARQFKEAGNDVIIATEWEAENEFVLAEGIRRIHAGLQEADANSNRIIKYFKRIQYLKELIQEEQPDIVIAFAIKANYRAVMATMRLKVPVLISIRTNPIGHYDDVISRIMVPLFFNRADGVVFQTTGQKAFFTKKMQQHSRIILNPINPKYIGRKQVEQRTKEIVHAGRLVDFKNQVMLIEGFARLYKKYPEYTLKLYGGDSGDGTKEKLLKAIENHRLEQVVTLMGASDTLERNLETGAFFVFTSDWEGLPNALMEAMALGLPVIATDCPCGGPNTVMTHKEDGYLIPIKDRESLVNAMEYFVQNPEIVNEYGVKARGISEIANATAIYEQWNEYVEELCTK